MKLGEPWSQLGGPQSLLGRPQSQPGGPQSQLRRPRSQLGGSQSWLGGPWSHLRGPWSHLGGPAERPEGGGQRQTERERERENGVFLVCGGTIGHRPLRRRCPKRGLIRGLGRFQTTFFTLPFCPLGKSHDLALRNVCSPYSMSPGIEYRLSFIQYTPYSVQHVTCD